MTTLDDVAQAPAAEHRQVWDLPVRVFHWTLAAAIVGAFVTNKLGVSYFKYHVWFGYGVIVLVLFRIVWGVVGTRHARFLNFVRGPAETARYALLLFRGRRPHYAGHNPLGGWMVLALLVAAGVQATLGLFGNDDIFNVGPLAGYVSKDLSLQLTSIHRRLFYGIVVAIAVHVVAVIAHHVFAREKLVHAMITGRKPKEVLAERDAIASSRSWLAALLTVVFALALAFVVSHAPAVADDGLF
ncbi:MAG: cytochrome b/b6 domain-containing protein [Methylocella sp.]